MNASDTKPGASVVAETLRSLSEQARICHDKIDQLEAGRSFNRAEVLAEVGKLLDACQNLRDAILSEDSSAKWSTKNELHALVERLAETATKRRRYLDLAEVLAAGTVAHRRERTRQERLSLRDKAVAELMEISERTAPPELPGPGVQEWLEWACGLEDDANEPELQVLKSSFPRLDDFVRQLEIDWWRDGSESRPLERAPEKSAPLSATKNGSRSSGNGAQALKQPALEPEPEPVAAASPVEPVTPAEHPAIEEKALVVPDLDADPDPSPVLSQDVQEEELPADALSPSKKGRISFFSWDQVEQFTRHVEKANVERKEARTIRALLGISHWLEPKEQSPLSHPKCGIRALTGQTGGADFDWVSPSDVMQAISQEDGLPLLTGGADLLRWGLQQPSERSFQGIAFIRRFTKEHVRAWFSDLYRIALSDKQLDDIETLTSGIPLLIGEMHKIIIPVPEDPPTWLGLARWIEIKGQFEKQLPSIAQELKKGTPAVRLTDREISLLNMVVIVSGDSTPETIATNLSENWERYEHPEFRAFGPRDETSLAVLLNLGLLPMRNVIGVAPSKALVPVKHDDAIRKMIELL